MSDIDDVGRLIRRTVLQEMSDTQVLLDFNNEQHALVFEEWLYNHWDEFKKYYAGEVGL